MTKSSSPMNPTTTLCARPNRYCLQSLWLFAFLALLGPRASAAPDLQGWNGVFGGTDNHVLKFAIGTNSANWGDTVPVQWTVANLTASAAGAFKIGFYISTSTDICGGSTYLLQKGSYPSGLSALGYNQGTWTLVLPSVNPLPGQPTTVYFGMKVDVDNEVAESNEGNNCNLGNGYDRQDAPVTITVAQPAIMVTDSVLPGDDRLVPFADVADDGPGNARGVQTVTIINKGKSTLNITSLALSGSPYFSLVQIASSIQNFISPSSLPRTIAKNGTECWVLTLQFDPATNAPASGTLTITSDDPTTPSLTVSLTGNGRPVPQIALTTPTATEIDFGDVVVGQYVRIVGVATTNLQIYNASVQDSGAYQAVVRNDFGSVTSQIATLNVPGPLLSANTRPPVRLVVLSHQGLVLATNDAVSQRNQLYNGPIVNANSR